MSDKGQMTKRKGGRRAEVGRKGLSVLGSGLGSRTGAVGRRWLGRDDGTIDWILSLRAAVCASRCLVISVMPMVRSLSSSGLTKDDRSPDASDVSIATSSVGFREADLESNAGVA